MNKAEALATIEQLHQKAEELKAFVAAEERDEVKSEALVAKRFVTTDPIKITANAKAVQTEITLQAPSDAHKQPGVFLTIPSSVPDPSLPIMEYLIREFMRRGGKVYDAEDRITRWCEMRFSLRGRLCDVWKGTCAKTFGALPLQPTVGELLGQSFVWLCDTSAEIETHRDMSFIELMNGKVDVINPMAFMTLMLTVPNIDDPSTYLSFKDWRWEWVAAINKEFAALGFSSSDGRGAGWDDPGSSYSYSRPRPAVRSHA